MPSLRIDTAIQSVSYLRILVYAGLVAILILLAYFAHLSLWQYGIILIVSVAVTGYLVLSRPILRHLSQPRLSKRVDTDWQLVMRTSRGDALWQAQLTSVECYRLLLHFEFIVVEPYQRSLSVTIFRDQVSRDAWQQLNILATVMSTG